MVVSLNNLADKKGAKITFKRVGRGVGSDKGKTCGRGMKGQKSRSGVSLHNFGGGQMPLYRRFAHIGFNNKIFKKVYAIINLSSIQNAIDNKKIASGKTITLEMLTKANVLDVSNKINTGLKVLGVGKITSAVTIECEKISETAKVAIEKAGGKVVVKESKVNTNEKGRFAKSEKNVDKKSVKNAPKNRIAKKSTNKNSAK